MAVWLIRMTPTHSFSIRWSLYQHVTSLLRDPIFVVAWKAFEVVGGLLLGSSQW
jgi:hypothetical protein